jgi:hypothetical protein
MLKNICLLQNICLFCRALLQKRPIFLSILLIVATPYHIWLWDPLATCYVRNCNPDTIYMKCVVPNYNRAGFWDFRIVECSSFILSNVVENQIIELGFEIFSNKLYAHHTSPEEVKFPNVSAIVIRYSKCSSCLTFENFCLHTMRVLGEAEIQKFRNCHQKARYRGAKTHRMP